MPQRYLQQFGKRHCFLPTMLSPRPTYTDFIFQDRSILAVAIPKITTEFNSLGDIGWYGSAYLLTSCCSQLMVGKLYAGYNVKWIFLGSLSIFEIGSILCAAAPNSVCLIIGRAISGLGATGISTGALLVR